MPIKTSAANSLTFSTERLLSAFRDALGNGGEMRRPGAQEWPNAVIRLRE